MNRLLPRFFALVMLSVTVAAVATYFAISYWFGDPLEEIARKQSAAQIFLLEQFVDKAGSDEWLVRLNKVRDVSNITYELIPLNVAQASLDTKKNAQLMAGGVVLDVSGKSFYRRVDLHGERYIGSEDDVIHVQGLPIDVGLAVRVEALRYVIVALFLLIPIIFWSRSHWRALQKLSRAADEFGEGKFGNKIVINDNDAVQPLAQCMNTMAHRIEDLLSAHKTLLHSVSHELRTPIARLEFGLELLREEAEGTLPEARVAGMQADLAELNALVSELLDLTKLDRQQDLNVTCVPIDEMLKQLHNSVGHKLDNRKFTIRAGENLNGIIADQKLLMRALSNLLLNAIKYGNQQVLLSVQVLEGGAIEFAVEDDGPGIPVDQRAAIFDPFFRLDQSRDRHTGGFGLGLTIAQKAVQLHGGEIQIGQSELGGAKFLFSIAQP